MLQRSFYLPTNLYKALQSEARQRGLHTAELIRELLQQSLQATHKKKLVSTDFLRKLISYKLKDKPKDLAQNHDRYTWE